jgi:fatty acid desaturase
VAGLHLGEEHPHLAAARRGLSQVFWGIAGGVIVAYVFFLALGAFGSGEVEALTVVVLVLAVLWLVHAALDARHRRRGERDARTTRARERRGF